MAVNFQDTTANVAIIPEIWSIRQYEVLRETLPFINSISTDYQGEISALGDIVNIHTIADFDEAGLLAEGAAGETDVSTISTQQLVINKRIYKDFSVTNKAQLQSLPFMDSLREKAVYAISKKMQQVIIDAISPSTSAPDHVISYDSGTTLGLADILESKELLDTQNLELSNRTVVLGSAQWNDIFNITGFNSKDFISSGSPLTTGELAGDILGFNPKMTTVVGNTSYWFHSSFMTMAVQEQLNISAYDLGSSGIRADRVNSDLLMGLKQLSDIRVVSMS